MSATGRVFQGAAPGTYKIYLKGLDEQGMIDLLAPFGRKPVRGASGRIVGFTNPFDHDLHFGADLPKRKGFVVGEIVRLKSGGPWMTIMGASEGAEGDMRYNVVWFSTEKDEFKMQSFLEQTIARDEA